MVDRVDLAREGTVAFLPSRLNRQPVIVRGLTADELWITVSVAAACGAALGIALAGLTGMIAVAPTVMLIGIAIGVFLGGDLLARHKRGRPETWLYRRLQCSISHRIPALRAHL